MAGSSGTTHKIATVVGARPQFIKCSLLSHALRGLGFTERLIHTGQHYNPQLSDIFFRELDIPEPDLNLGIGSDTQGRQTGRMMIALEEAFEQDRPDLALVFGDTNSTLAAALVAVKMGIPLAHVESGMRSHNRAMPEEHNRVVTDHLSDLLFCHNETTAARLAGEKIDGRVIVSGDTMRETVSHFLPRALDRTGPDERLGLTGQPYAVLTVHRPVNADQRDALGEIIEGANRLGMPVVFPIHPRTRRQEDFSNLQSSGRLHLIEPLGYLDMLALVHRAALVLTDSGGLQKEAFFLQTPCVTLRGETEWTETVEAGMNVLAGDRPHAGHLAAIAGEMLLRHGPGTEPAPSIETIDRLFGPIDVSRRIAGAIAEMLG